MEYDADRVVVLVSDNGAGFVPSAVAPVGTERPDFAGQPERIGGYGLRLVEEMSDHLEFRRSDPTGPTVRAEKQLHYQSAADLNYARNLSHGGGLHGDSDQISRIAPSAALSSI